MNRREFLRQTGAAAGVAAILGSGVRAAEQVVAGGFGRVAILVEPANSHPTATPAQWALGQLKQALVARGFSVRNCARLEDLEPGEFGIVVAGRDAAAALETGIDLPAGPEVLAIAPAMRSGRELLAIMGNDTRGFVYALNEIADAVALGADPRAALRPGAPRVEQPANRVRGVMRLFASEVEDKVWFNDRDFWREYFALLAAQRFNRFNLALGLGYDQPIGLTDTYFYFAYPFLVDVPGYKVRAVGLPDVERDANLAMLRWISDEAAAHGLDFQLGLWTHAYRWIDSPRVNYVIEGLTPDTHAPYCRDAMALVLQECPNITGVTIRIHGESGVPEGSYDLWRTIFDGCTRAGRTVALDLHAKGLDQPTLDAALATGAPLTISPKFWAEHMGLPYHQAAIRPTELPTGRPGRGPFTQSEGARSFLRYGYGDLLRENRRYAVVHRIWPGTQRVLLWGDPTFAAAYGRVASLCGSAGCEVFDPLSFKGRKGSGLPGGRDGYADTSLRAAGADFEKYRLTYRLWGRLLYNPETAPDIWERKWRADYGPLAGADAGKALELASRILPLVTTAHCPSAANNNYWPEMYVNMAVVDTGGSTEPYTDTPKPIRFGTVSPLDPQLFATVEEHAGDLLGWENGAKYSPAEVSQWLEILANDANAALDLAVEKHANPRAPAFRRFTIDVRVLIGLGRFFAQKLRAAVMFAVYQRSGEMAMKEPAVGAYHAARSEWARVVELTTGVYVPDVGYGEGWFQRGHWSDRLPAIDRDIAAMKAAPVPKTTIALDPAKVDAIFRKILAPPARKVDAVHRAPASFAPGTAIVLELAAPEVAAKGTVKLLYRRMHQAESWRDLEMDRAAGVFRAAIPGDYAGADYPLQYYFEVTDAQGRTAMFPGLGPELTRTPYFVLRPA